MSSRHIFYGPRTSKTMVSKKEIPKKEMDLNLFFYDVTHDVSPKNFLPIRIFKNALVIFCFSSRTSKPMFSKTLVGV